MNSSLHLTQPVASTTTLLSAAKLTTLLFLSATVGVWVRVSSRNVVCIVRLTDIVVVIVDDDNDNDGYNIFREWLFTKTKIYEIFAVTKKALVCVRSNTLLSVCKVICKDTTPMEGDQKPWHFNIFVIETIGSKNYIKYPIGRTKK